MTKKVFSVKDGSIKVKNGYLVLFENDKSIAATCNTPLTSIHLLPSTLIRKPKTDEELAEGYYPKEWSDKHYGAIQSAFLAGRKSVVGEFHLTTDEVIDLINLARTRERDLYNGDGIDYKYSQNEIISSLTPPIYPTTITVDYDGEKYLWETLKAEYEQH